MPSLTSPNCSGPCLPGYYCPAGSFSPTVFPCPAGSYCGTGSAVGTSCNAGQYSLTGAAACTNCSAGTYGVTGGLASAACSGLCSAGYVCPAGSVSPTAELCPAGTYSLAGSWACLQCPSGTYGATPGAVSASCSGPCAPGTYGGSHGQTSSACSGNCAAGYSCPAGSVSPTTSVCPAGRFSLPGAAACSDCPGGRYGATPAMANASCSGPCSPGYACAAGSTNATATVCPAGRYSSEAAAVCTPCSAGLYGASSGQSSPQCNGACAAGRYGTAPGATSSTCDGPCAAGYACGDGSTSPTAQLCPAGTYAVVGSAVCTNCSAGRYGASPGATTATCSGQCQVSVEAYGWRFLRATIAYVVGVRGPCSAWLIRCAGWLLLPRGVGQTHFSAVSRGVRVPHGNGQRHCVPLRPRDVHLWRRRDVQPVQCGALRCSRSHGVVGVLWRLFAGLVLPCGVHQRHRGSVPCRPVLRVGCWDATTMCPRVLW